MTTKDFGEIESDYAFFMMHATEAESDAAAYASNLDGFAEGRTSIRLLDFGCGTGDFTERLLSTLNWPPETLQLALLEPVRSQCEAAVERLTKFSQHPVETLESLSSAQELRFDLVLSNHVLYYVDDLRATLEKAIKLLQPGGKLLLAIAGWDNSLIEFWKVGFDLMGQPVPYHVAEDVEAILSSQGARFRKSKAFYQLRFPDNVANRIKILHFLFGEHLQEISLERLLGLFDRFVRGNQIEVNTDSDHFIIEPC